MQVEARIKNYIEGKGISQAYLSRQTGISAVKLNLSLNKKRTMKLDEFRAICAALGVSADMFMESCPKTK